MSQRFVVDTNVVSKLYLRDEQWTANTDTLFAKFARGGVELVAPRLIRYELPATIRKAITGGRISVKDGQQAILRFRDLPLSIANDEDIFEEAFRFANQYLCSYYDAIFLTLADDLGWSFVTADVKLCKQLQPRLPFIIPLNKLS